ncbi:AAA family ATPase [Silicimonas algicola]|uniref:Putative ATPase n=1 Tax=Silicimonas algicola TaxID=1826607 RepID=A0A316G2A3_9RHOB|nr:AAA family ATPase [Silicimonas algicola]PWK55061.1 putative ATPase [Silicimonas algicola]
MGILINRVRLRNFKSIASCDVRLTDLCALVGVNGAGKSNFLDSFSFVSDACNSTLETAIRNRGGLGAVRRRSEGHPNNFGMSFSVNLSGGLNAFFAFEISATPGGRFEVSRERAAISESDGIGVAEYEIKRGDLNKFTISGAKPDVRPDRLFLTSVSGLRPFDLLFDALAGISIYDINPEDFRYPQPHEAGDVLSPSGQNLASVFRRLSDSSSETYDRIGEYLQKIVSSVVGVQPKSLGPTETIQFQQFVQNSKHPWKFDALNMSNGTLRSLGVLTALFHREVLAEGQTPFIGVEEPEGTIHPGAAAVLMDAIIEASKSRQILLTTHSPELLDHEGIDEENLFIVTSERNESWIGNADSASREAMRKSLLTAGELLRTNQLSPENASDRMLKQSDLFSS